MTHDDAADALMRTVRGLTRWHIDALRRLAAVRS